ncbi:MAG: spermidine synthase [Abditibacteriota bacterium]|nr:spermidine synthase [Abditibacteriota bacterium]
METTLEPLAREGDANDIPEAAVSEAPLSEEARREVMTLLASIFVIAACGLIYELLIATVSSYLLGSSVVQFSISIGVFIGAMGLGSHISSYLQKRLLLVFILVEIALGVAGAISVPLLFWAYAHGTAYWIALYAALITIGGLTGLELPVLTRLLKPYGSLRTVIARALSFDYVGALAGSLLFPLLLLPSLGMARTAFVVGALNVAVAAWNAWVFRDKLREARLVMGCCVVLGVVLGMGFISSLKVLSFLERGLYEDEIIYSAQTPYQRIIVTRWREDTRLFLDGNLQFSTTDEYRYHESLVHPAMSLSGRPENILVLGGGDGLAVREVLKYPEVKQVTLIDIDPRMTDLGKTFPAFLEINKRALHDPRVKLVHEDAHKFLERNTQLYDCIIGDLPDPNTDVLAKLYSREFYKLIRRHLAASGVFVTQATSPFFAREAFWCITRTLDDADLHVAPYHTYVPSFGDWGFVLASPHQLHRERAKVRVPTQYLTDTLLAELFVLGRDISEIPIDVSTLDRPTILEYYLHNWKQWE